MLPRLKTKNNDLIYKAPVYRRTLVSLADSSSCADKLGANVWRGIRKSRAWIQKQPMNRYQQWNRSETSRQKVQHSVDKWRPLK